MEKRPSVPVSKNLMSLALVSKKLLKLKITGHTIFSRKICACMTSSLACSFHTISPTQHIYSSIGCNSLIIPRGRLFSLGS
jgi:hypothetical protein